MSSSQYLQRVLRRRHLKQFSELWSGRNLFRNVMTSSRSSQRTLTVENMNQNVRMMEHVIRGPLYARAIQIEKELKEGQKKPFPQVLYTSYGDGQGMGQSPLTFVRQVLAAASYAPLLEDPNFPQDIKDKVKVILSSCRGGSVGAYADPGGLVAVRKHCAEFITNRDGGITSDYNDITLCGGASDAIKGLMRLFINIENGKRSGILLPIPQYPFYFAITSELCLGQVGYYLDESDNWALNIGELKRALDEGRKKCNVRALVVINPGNPTGQVLSRKNIEDIIKFAYEENLFIFADEVYQENIYDESCQFHSFKKVVMELGAPYNKIQVASLNSCSKGYMGECGLRGAYVEVINLPADVRAMYLKSVAAALCPTVLGQVAVDCLVKPPKEGEPSYPLWKKERDSLLGSLRKRAALVADGFRSIDGISCNPVQGAMYAFPRLHLPDGALKKAKENNLKPDEYYALQLLESTGICVTPGTSFSQKEGTHHIRCTILPPIDALESMFEEFKKFHTKFMEEHRN